MVFYFLFEISNLKSELGEEFSNFYQDPSTQNMKVIINQHHVFTGAQHVQLLNVLEALFSELLLPCPVHCLLLLLASPGDPQF